MGLLACTTAKTFEFVSTEDPDAHVEDELIDDTKPPGPRNTRKVVVGHEPGASVFKVSGLDARLMGYIYDNAQHLTGKQDSDEFGINTRVNATNLDCVRFGLRELPQPWVDKDGAEVVMETETATVLGRPFKAATSKVLDSLGLRLINEMAGVIKEASEMTKADVKKSAPASSPSSSSQTASA